MGMKVTELDESIIQQIGHAFGYYDYGAERGLIDAFPSRDAALAFICGYVRMVLGSGMLYTTSENGEAYIAYKLPGQKIGLKAALSLPKGHMRRVMYMALAAGNRLGIPVILDTDAQSKCDKYIHLGMRLAGTRHLGTYGVLYGLIKYPNRQGA